MILLISAHSQNPPPHHVIDRSVYVACVFPWPRQDPRARAIGNNICPVAGGLLSPIRRASICMPAEIGGGRVIGSTSLFQDI